MPGKWHANNLKYDYWFEKPECLILIERMPHWLGNLPPNNTTAFNSYLTS